MAEKKREDEVARAIRRIGGVWLRGVVAATILNYIFFSFDQFLGFTSSIKSRIKPPPHFYERVYGRIGAYVRSVGIASKRVSTYIKSYVSSSAHGFMSSSGTVSASTTATQITPLTEYTSATISPYVRFSGEYTSTGTITASVHYVAGAVEDSGTNPNDPTWTPAGGWTNVWSFFSEDELPDFANGGYNYAYVDTTTNTLQFNPDSGKTGNVNRVGSLAGTAMFHRTAICFNITSISTYPTSRYDILFVDWGDGVDGYTSGVAIDADGIKLFDDGTGVSSTILPVGQYIIVVIDYDNKYIRAYDTSKNILDEMTISPRGTTGAVDYNIFIYEHNLSGIAYNIKVDWVGTYETPS